ncbi:hypothetical protein HDA32_000368 [Spinactinospora alkalitolerans]|uniref:Uncharacterized protein n=1 Tax=Spinactinospora alkalitolerans TaxID=687207 RepID=A0A852TMU0_9ACTN|nr:hypothetical protein [Spinactinospora alkalitolerans]NYE45248.1 hypothetical protein [Spinactinospora alkalitolerans]
MSRRATRAIAGFAAAALTTAWPLTAQPAAWAGEPDRSMHAAVTSSGATRTVDADVVPYTCVAGEDGRARPHEAELAIEVPAQVAGGDEVTVQLSRFTGFFERWTDQPVEVGAAALTAEIRLTGDAAPLPTVTLSGSSVEESPAAGPDVPDVPPVKFGAITGSFTAAGAGEIAFASGTITIDVDQERGPLTTVCSPADETAPLAATAITGEGEGERGAEHGGAAEPAAPGAVTVPGRIQWNGIYRCTSSDTSLQPDFDSPATVTVTTEETDSGVGDTIEVAGEFSLEKGPRSPMKLAPEAATAELSVALSGAAAPERTLTLRTRNADPLPAGQDILFPEATGYLTPGREGEVGFAVGGLNLSIMGGIVEVECLPDGAVGNGGDGGEPPGPAAASDPVPPAGERTDARPAPAEDGAREPIPVTGAALTGLVAAAFVAIGGGAAAMLLSRRRRAARGGSAGGS